MSKVFVIPPVKQNISDAERFGNIVELFQGSDFRPSVWSDEYVFAMIDALERKGYDNANDFILIVGPLISLVTLSCALTRLHKSFRALVFCANDQGYRELRLGEPEWVTPPGETSTS